MVCGCSGNRKIRIYLKHWKNFVIYFYKALLVQSVDVIDGFCLKEKSEELNVLKQLFNSLSDEDKKTFLDSLQYKQKVFVDVQDIIKPRTPITCPHCSSSYFVKNETKGGTQRYLMP